MPVKLGAILLSLCLLTATPATQYSYEVCPLGNTIIDSFFVERASSRLNGGAFNTMNETCAGKAAKMIYDGSCACHLHKCGTPHTEEYDHTASGFWNVVCPF